MCPPSTLFCQRSKISNGFNLCLATSHCFSLRNPPPLFEPPVGFFFSLAFDVANYLFGSVLPWGSVGRRSKKKRDLPPGFEVYHPVWPPRPPQPQPWTPRMCGMVSLASPFSPGCTLHCREGIFLLQGVWIFSRLAGTFF